MSVLVIVKVTADKAAFEQLVADRGDQMFPRRVKRPGQFTIGSDSVPMVPSSSSMRGATSRRL